MTNTANSPKTILFVCTGNLCRSPMAAALFREQIKQRGDDPQRYHVYSAGILDINNHPAPEFAVQVMHDYGLDITAHRSHELNVIDVKNANLILTMTAAQQEVIQVEFPEYRDKVYMLSEVLEQQYDIQDPYGLELDAYRYAAEEIKSIIKEGYDNIITLAAGEPKSA